MHKALKTTELFDLDQTVAKPLLETCEYPWQALPQIRDFILELGHGLSSEDFFHPQEDVWISKEAKVFPSAYIKGPCIVMAHSEVRHCAFIRGNALIGEHCVVGNSTELKNVILFNHVQVPHYNYVGDSILGYYSHMGAGSITSNVKSDKAKVVIHGDEDHIMTDLKKVGAMVGDHVEVGCNSVLNPGTVIGPNSSVYPLSMVRGIVPADSIYKSMRGTIHERVGQCD